MTQQNRKGFRGYMGARMSMQRSTPQHIQQMVMREYCKSRNMSYLLAATEYCMPGCTMILDAVLDELDHIEGIVMFSLALFPRVRAKREEMYRRLFEKGCTLHLAAEGIAIRTPEDAAHVEESMLVQEVMGQQSAETLGNLRMWDDAHATV
jgi:sporadic carbohydrate cluster protein (TIGR04323 family)